MARSARLCLLLSAFASLLCFAAPAFAAAGPTSVSLGITAGSNSVSTVPSSTVVTLTATVAAGSTAVTPGQVMFCDASAAFCQNASLGVSQIVSSGKATLTFTPGPGAHSYKAVFLGTKAYASSTSTAQPLTVTAAVATSTGLVSAPVSGSPGTYNLTAQISGTGPYANLSGTASFLDTTTGTTLGTATVIPGFVPHYTLGTGVNIAVGNESPGYATADFNGDGKLDLAVANNEFLTYIATDNKITILLGNGNGTFSAAPDVTSVNSNWIVAGDFNNDGRPDLAAALGSSVQILLGSGNGTFTASGNIPAADPGVLATGDLNQDGNLDIVVAGYDSTITILLGNGSGGFTPTSFTLPTTYGGTAALADFDGDGIPDLAVSGEYYNAANPNTDSYSLFLYHGNGNGSFSATPSTLVSGVLDIGMIYAADFNGDGKSDLSLSFDSASGSGLAVQILLGKGDGTFTSATPLTPTPNSSLALSQSQNYAIGDFNNDGKADIAWGDYFTLEIYTSNGDGSFTSAYTAPGPTSGPDYYLVGLGDLNGDGVPDLFTVNSDQKMATSFLTVEAHGAGASLSNALVGGSGSHSITTTYSGDSAYTTSTSSAVSLAAAAIPTTLTITATPNSDPVGTAIALKATLAPAASGSLKTDGESITFRNGSTSLGTATLSGGIATFSPTTLAQGTNSITATYAGDSSFAASNAVAVPVTITAPLVPGISLSSTSLTFSTQVPGSTSASQTVTVTNSGTAPLTFNSIAASGDFAQTNTCTSAIAPAATCAIAVTFTPTATGSRTGSLTLTDNVSGSPQTIALTGNGSTTTVSLTPAATSLTIANPGASATTTVAIAPSPGFTGPVSLSCLVAYDGTGTPSAPPTCALSPSSGTISSSSSFSTTLTIATTSTTASLSPHAIPLFPPVQAVSLAGLILFGCLVPRGWRRGGLLALIFAALISLAGCGGHSSPPPSTPANTGTTTGSYHVTVTATTSSATANLTIPIAVQ